MIDINGDLCHRTIVKNSKPKLSFDIGADYGEWRGVLFDKLKELTGIDLIEDNRCEPNLTVEEDITFDEYRRIRFVFYSETDAAVPCYLLIPNGKKEKYPLTIALQGHDEAGFRRSSGVNKSNDGREGHGVNAVRCGFAALCIEQRSMGERMPKDPEDRRFVCGVQTNNAFMLGRTTVGERVWDVMRAIDLLGEFPEIDTERIMIMGDSGGGTASYYSACFDPRIKICVPCYAFCPYSASIMAMLHCSCNYIPSAYRYFEMQDLSALIAPRKLLLVNATLDTIFPIGAAREAFETVKDIYRAAGADGNAEIFEIPKGHYMMPDSVWDRIKEFTGW